MLIQLLVERDQNTCVVKLAGTTYTFKRNAHGHLVANIENEEHIRWVSNPSHNTSFKIYANPKKEPVNEPPAVKVIDEAVEEEIKPEVVAEEVPASQPEEEDAPDQAPKPKRKRRK